MKEKIYEIPDKLVGYYYPETKTIVDHWTDIGASFEEWKSTIYDIGIMKSVQEKGALTWITDTSNAKGVFKPEIQKFREEVSGMAMAKSGIKLFITVTSASAIATLSAKKTLQAYSGNGEMKTASASNLEEAYEIRDRELS